MVARTEASPTDDTRRADLLGHFPDAAGARRALEALDAHGIAAHRVERAPRPAQPGPSRRQWLVGGGLGVLVGALVGGAIGVDAASVPGSPEAGVPLVAAVLGAFVLGSVGLFAAYAWSRRRGRRAAGRDHAAGAETETLVHAQVAPADVDAAEAAFRAAGAARIDAVGPGRAVPPPPPGS